MPCKTNEPQFNFCGSFDFLFKIIKIFCVEKLRYSNSKPITQLFYRGNGCAVVALADYIVDR